MNRRAALALRQPATLIPPLSLFYSLEEYEQAEWGHFAAGQRGQGGSHAQLHDTMNALLPLVIKGFDEVDIKSMSLPNALRLIIRSAGRRVSKRADGGRATEG